MFSRDSPGRRDGMRKRWVPTAAGKMRGDFRARSAVGGLPACSPAPLSRCHRQEASHEEAGGKTQAMKGFDEELEETRGGEHDSACRDRLAARRLGGGAGVLDLLQPELEVASAQR